MFSIISIFWFFRESKNILFWLYLWQLKEYHIGRFFDHFKTDKGKKILFSPILFAKIILAGLFIFNGKLFSVWFFILFLIYLFESAIFLKSILSKQIKKPVITGKTTFLIFISFAVAILFLWRASFFSENPLIPFYLLIFDILTPIIFSFVILLFQPFFVFIRNNMLKKAGEKVKGFKGLTVIGITGSYGKTSTKEFLTTILAKKLKVLSTKEHQNSEVGIAKCILNDLNAEHQIFIVEMGAYRKGGIKLLADMVKPKIGIVTGINEQHLALFGSLENLLSAEGGRELAAALPKEGFLVLNGDNKFCLDLYKKTPDVNKRVYTTYAGIIDSDIWTEDISVEKNAISFVAISKKREMANFNVNVLGKQNVQNLLAAIIVARELGLSFGEISQACLNIKQEQAGMILKPGKHGIDIIDSSYSANPDGVFADLEFLNIFPNKKAIVMPCLIELGPKSAEIHQKIGRKIGEVCNLAIITSKEKFEDIKRGAIEAGIKPNNILLCDNPNEISIMISLFCKTGDAVLLEGRGPVKLLNLLV